MKKQYAISAFAALVLLCGCFRTVYVDPFSPGVNIAGVPVGAQQGSLSVLVNTQGTWRVSCNEPWISLDVNGGEGRAAFTASYASNESDITVRREARTARIIVGLDSKMVSDTITIVQQGFISGGIAVQVYDDPDISVEFDSRALREASVLCCSLEGVESADYESAVSWAAEQAVVRVIDGRVYGGLDGIGIAGCDFAGMDAAEELLAFRELIGNTLNSAGDTFGKWIVCGQTYHLSMMQTGYPSAPSWYPEDARAAIFDADRFAWQNNLYDILWMKLQDYTVTYTDSENRSYQADYMYVSSTLLSDVLDVELLSPVYGMSHKPVKITLKY